MTTISVTAEHITKGKRQMCEFCPVALAAIDAFPDLTRIVVGTTEMTITDGNGKLTDIELPPSAIEFIEAFDDEQGVEPFTFELDYPAVAA